VFTPSAVRPVLEDQHHVYNTRYRQHYVCLFQHIRTVAHREIKLS